MTELINQYFCPVCENGIESFLPFGINPRPNAQCPLCKSLERHRLIWLYFKNKTNLFKDNLKILHIAPEHLISNKLNEMSNLDYISADLLSPSAMIQMDITAIQFIDNSFDVIYANHVLEHIPDDLKAMCELRRILKPTGWAILQVPIWGDKTLEDANISTSEEREKLFGQKDHVRRYGLDGIYKKRLEIAGFEVFVDSYVRSLGSDVIKKYGLMPDEDIYFCRKSSSYIK